MAGGPRRGGLNVWYSLGLRVSAEGVISDVRWSGPADKAKLAPGQKIIAVDGRVFSGDALKAAIKNAKGKTEPIHFILQSDTFVTLADIDYHDGERYPSLVRVEEPPPTSTTSPNPSPPPKRPPQKRNPLRNSPVPNKERVSQEARSFSLLCCHSRTESI